MQAIQPQGVLKGVNCLRELLELRINTPEEIPGIGVRIVDFRHAAEFLNRRLRITAVLVEHSERVPDMRVSRIGLGGLLENLPGWVHSCQVQQRDSLVKLGNPQGAIERSSLFKSFQRLFKELLIHVCTAQVVHASRFGSIALCVGSRSKQQSERQ